MSWIEIKNERDLPPEGKYVLARHNRGTWHDSDDQANVNCVVVKLKKGLSIEDRNKMISGEIPDYEDSPGWCLSTGWTISKRSIVYKNEDEHGNNRVPYKWEMFGPDSFFGQSITHWMPIEPITVGVCPVGDNLVET